MSLIGLPLLLTSCVVALAAVVALVLLWPRLFGWLQAVRVVGVLLCELLVVAVIGLAVNRSDAFYPSWQALFGDAMPAIGAQQQVAQLSVRLESERARGARHGLSFDWQRAQVDAWHLQAPPSVCLPRAYFLEPNRALPVVAVLSGPAQTGAWSHARLASLAASSSAVVLLLRPAAGTLAPQAATQMLDKLAADLRVMPAYWGLVGEASAIPAALDLFRAAPARFGALALTGTGAAARPLAAAAHAVAGARPLLTTSQDDPAATLRWIYLELPPALGPPLVVGPGATKPGRP